MILSPSPSAPARNAAKPRPSSIKAKIKERILDAFGVQRRLPEGNGLLLTFDDGPDPETTPAVLHLLAEFGAKAVFFIVGNRIPKAPHVLARILAEGHSIGNHTYLHPLDRVPPLAAYYRDVKQCQAVIESHTGRRPILFRPPMGRLTLGSLVAPRLAGLRTMLWSVDVDDWTLRNETDSVAAGRRLAASAAPGDIVLLHDDNPCVLTVLETALPQLRTRRLDLGQALSGLKC